MRSSRLVLGAISAAGALVISAGPADAQVLHEFTITSTTFDRAGNARVELSVDCSLSGYGWDSDSYAMSMWVTVEQTRGHRQVLATHSARPLLCSNGRAAATIVVDPEDGRFVGGPAVVDAFAFADVWSLDPEYGYEYFEEEYLQETVRLRRAKPNR